MSLRATTPSPPGRALSRTYPSGHRTPQPSGRTYLPWLVVALVMAVLVIAGLVVALLDVGGRASQPPGSYAFPIATYPNGVVVQRLWSVSRGGAFQGSVVVADGGERALVAAIQEVIPAEVAPSLDDVTFTPQPVALDSQHSVARFSAALTPGMTYEFSYRARLHAGVGGPGDLRTWGGQAAEAAAALPAPGAYSAATLLTLTGPSTLNLAVGQGAPVPTVKGVMSDGSVAPEAFLGAVSWDSDDTTVATVSGGVVHGVGEGDATLTGSLGEATLSVDVAVAEAVSNPVPQPKPVAQPPAAASSAPPAPAPGRVAVYGLTWGTYWFFYTATTQEVSSSERISGYTPFGPGGVAFYGCSGPNAIPVQRWVTEPMNFHEFTTSASEGASLQARGYTKESGDAFGSCPASTPGVVPVYRLYWPALGAPQFTTSQATVNAAVAAGWQNEDIAWYAYPP